LAIGPAYVASMRCLEKNGLGVCVNTPSVKEITKTLSQGIWHGDYADKAAAFLNSCAASSNGERLKAIILKTTQS